MENKKGSKPASFDIEKGVLISCKGGGEEVVVPEGVRVIGQAAFFMKRTVRVVLPEGVREIRKDAFANCYRLREIVLPDSLEKIGQSAFSDCRELERIELPAGVKEIGAKAFSGTWALKSFRFPDGVESIKKDVFYGMGRDRVDEMILPAGLKKIEEKAFACRMERLVFRGEDPEVERHAFRLPFGADAAIGELVVSEEVKSIPGYAFADCGAIPKIEFLSRETKVGGSAFAPEAFPALAAAAYPEQLGTKMRAQLAPFTAELIESGAAPSKEYSELWTKAIRAQKNTLEEEIAEHEALCVLMLREGLVSADCARRLMEKAGESGAPELKFRLLDYLGHGAAADAAPEPDLDKIPSLQEVRKLFKLVTKGDKAEITGYKGEGGDVSIPPAAGKYRVTAIGAEAFKKCASVRSVTIPEGVTYIGRKAFADCSSLESVTLPDSLLSIDNSAFENCASLKSLIIPAQVRRIGCEAFHGCLGLREFELQNPACKIEWMCFRGCPDLTIRAPAGSYAEQYAKERNIPFEAE